jgi:hypothetical protein
VNHRLSGRARWADPAVIPGIAVALLLAVELGAQEPARTGEGVGFRAAISADTVYVGQQATYTLTVRIPTEVRQRLRRNPEFVPPEARAVLAYDLPLARTPATEEEVEVHVFRRALFPLTPGRYPIPAARLSYSIPQSPSFFSREEERTLRSEPVSFVAIDPPLRGRPTEWLGAVGRWNATARAEAGGARVGDPFVLVLRLTGEGNAALLPRPTIDLDWADVVAEDERIVLDSTPTLFSGMKEFSWLVTPRVNGSRVIPAIAYTYFDPSARRYVRTASNAFRIQVRAGDIVALPARKAVVRAVVPLSLRPALAGPTALRLPGGALWFWIAALAPLPWAVRRLIGTRKRLTEIELARARDARSTSPRTRFDAAVQARTGIALSAVTAPGEFSTALRLAGVTEATAQDAEGLRDTFDIESFAPKAKTRSTPRSTATPDSMRARVDAILARIDLEAKRRAAPLVLLALLLGAACDAPSGGESAVRAFAEGRTAFVGGDFTRSRDAFLRSAQAAPRDPNAWANLGTAAWQAGDTATAVLGWQRALRLDPLDPDLRSRLSQVRAPQRRGAARVWPVPPLPVALLAVVLWCGAWGWMAKRAWRDRPSGIAPRLVMVPALALAAGAFWLDTELRGRDIAVVAVAGPLLALPALGADPGPVPLVGEIVRVRERRGVWVRVELDADRSGWYPAERTLSLTRD